MFANATSLVVSPVLQVGLVAAIECLPSHHNKKLDSFAQKIDEKSGKALQSQPLFSVRELDENYLKPLGLKRLQHLFTSKKLEEIRKKAYLSPAVLHQCFLREIAGRSVMDKTYRIGGFGPMNQKLRLLYVQDLEEQSVRELWSALNRLKMQFRLSIEKAENHLKATHLSNINSSSTLAIDSLGLMFGSITNAVPAAKRHTQFKNYCVEALLTPSSKVDASAEDIFLLIRWGLIKPKFKVHPYPENDRLLHTLLDKARGAYAVNDGHAAAYYLNVFKKLLSLGANPDARLMTTGQTALHMTACNELLSPFAEALLNAGANPQLRASFRDRTQDESPNLQNPQNRQYATNRQALTALELAPQRPDSPIRELLENAEARAAETLQNTVV